MRRLLALLLVIGCTACDFTGPAPRRPLAGQWVGSTSEIRVRLNMTEYYSEGSFLSGWVLDGTGTLIMLASGDSLPFVVAGAEFGNSVIINMQVPPKADAPAFSSTFYGHFWGKLDDANALTGAIDGSVQNVVGPLVSGVYGAHKIVMERR
jgi:hypothetical protein